MPENLYPQNFYARILNMSKIARKKNIPIIFLKIYKKQNKSQYKNSLDTKDAQKNELSNAFCFMEIGREFWEKLTSKDTPN